MKIKNSQNVTPQTPTSFTAFMCVITPRLKRKAYYLGHSELPYINKHIPNSNQPIPISYYWFTRGYIKPKSVLLKFHIKYNPVTKFESVERRYLQTLKPFTFLMSLPPFQVSFNREIRSVTDLQQDYVIRFKRRPNVCVHLICVRIWT